MRFSNTSENEKAALHVIVRAADDSRREELNLRACAVGSAVGAKAKRKDIEKDECGDEANEDQQFHIRAPLESRAPVRDKHIESVIYNSVSTPILSHYRDIRNTFCKPVMTQS